MATDKNTSYVSTEIMGGLGNQLFQIANVVAYKYFIDNNKEIILKYEDNLHNNFNLPRKTYWNSLFKNQFNVINKDEYNEINFIPLHERVWYKNLINTYTKVPFNIQFRGYFQSFRYFDENIRKIMRNYVYSNNELLSKAKELYENIKKSFDVTNEDELISVHIRRTDYLLNPDHDYSLPLEYYTEALKIANKKKIVVFSDDIEWCRNNFDRDIYNYDKIHYVDINDVAIEFLLMSLFKNNVIANSTFSLWASYISDYNDKMIIAPKQWLAIKLNVDHSEIYHEYITNII
jgi:hypothetical protein